MILKFYKYQATGNDFIILNGFGHGINLTDDQIRFLCDRHFGIGADGLIILRPDSDAEFFMEFYNPDASIATFCGNGGRTIVLFAYMQGLIQATTRFRALDGFHQASVIGENRVKLQMSDVSSMIETTYGLYLNTGTYHVVIFRDDLDELDIMLEAPPIRYAKEFSPDGTNVNFVQYKEKNLIRVRTYEKGVEAETLSCGTGVVASALAAAWRYGLRSPITVLTRGGKLEVEFERTGSGFEKIFLTGETKFVFWGEINI